MSFVTEALAVRESVVFKELSNFHLANFSEQTNVINWKKGIKSAAKRNRKILREEIIKLGKVKTEE
jgi:hypothetical protein